MIDPFDSPVTDPTALYAIRDRLYAADMLIAAVSGLDFFTWLDEPPRHRRGHRRPGSASTAGRST